jgi:hypothetical protein
MEKGLNLRSGDQVVSVDRTVKKKGRNLFISFKASMLATENRQIPG